MVKQLEADIAIIAGLAAAVAAAEGGAKVINFEKSPSTGGTGNMGMGPLGVETRQQRLKQIQLTREEAFNAFMNYTHWRVDARLVKAYIDKSASTIEWLEKMGVEFVEPAAYFPGSNFTWHLVKPPAGRPGPMSAAAMMKVMAQTATELGVKILLQTPANKILKEGNRVVGVEGTDKSGETVQVKSKAVIVATGGFGDNPEWLKKYSGYDWGKDLFSMRIPGLAGDGIKMAWEAGAGSEGMNVEIIYDVPNLMDGDLMNGFKQPCLMVNLQGERFIDEAIMGNTTYTGNALARQKDRCGFLILDSAIKKYYETDSLDILSVVFYGYKIDNFEGKLKKMLDNGFKYAFMADTIDELAAKTGIDAANLKKTIEVYNKACETGRDTVLNKNPRYLRPIAKPPFYAGKHFPGAYGSLGGIKINYKTEVVSQNFDIIPGLYAAGTDACSIYGDSYVFILPGNTMGFALNSARMAAEHALEYIKTVK
jgi:fumarate reductase flavoprotein subunit